MANWSDELRVKKGSAAAGEERDRPDGAGERGPALSEMRTDRGVVLTTAKPGRHESQLPSMVGSNLLVRTTAYCHKENDHIEYGKLNAAGGYLQFGMVRSAAADWSRFPLGTRFRIEGKPYEYDIDDYGSALAGTNTIDLYKPQLCMMNEWGVRHVAIQILEWGCFEKSREILKSREHVEHADHVRQMLRDIERRYSSPRAATEGSGSPGEARPDCA